MLKIISFLSEIPWIRSLLPATHSYMCYIMLCSNWLHFLLGYMYLFIWRKQSELGKFYSTRGSAILWMSAHWKWWEKMAGSGGSKKLLSPEGWCQVPIVVLLIVYSTSSQYRHFLCHLLLYFILGLSWTLAQHPVEELTVLLGCSIDYCSIWNIRYKYCAVAVRLLQEVWNPSAHCPADLLVFDFLLKKMFLDVQKSQ